MKISKLLLASFSLLLICSSSFAQSNKQLPGSLAMETLTGKKVKLKEYVAKKGKVTVVNFWATWCKPCKEELDNINSDYLEDWQDDYDIEFIAVSMDNSRTKHKVKGVVDTKGWEYDILCNPDNSAYQMLGFNSCPYTLLLNKDGNIVYKHTGYKPGDEEELEAQIAKASK
jgi:cytochrome c biogenesis protein CcmG, thiol:disulfide interchange protein DsbE